jgi:hypothetical protein
VKGKDVVSYCVMAGLLSPCVTLDLSHQPKAWTLGVVMASSTSSAVTAINLITGQPLISVYSDYRQTTIFPSST